MHGVPARQGLLQGFPSALVPAVFEMSSIRSSISVRMALLDWEESTKPISPVIRTTTAHRTTTAVIVRLRLFFFFTGTPLPERIQRSYHFYGKQHAGCHPGQIIFPGHYTPGERIAQETGQPFGQIKPV